MTKCSLCDKDSFSGDMRMELCPDCIISLANEVMGKRRITKFELRIGKKIILGIYKGEKIVDKTEFILLKEI